MESATARDHMYQELLTRLAEEQSRFKSGLQPPATEEHIQELVEGAREELHTGLPGEYLAFLRLTNGLDWNGVVIYASDNVPIVGHPDRPIPDVVEMNLNYREDARFEDLLVLGSDGMDIYTYRISKGVYEVYDEVPHELVETIPTFDELMTKALTRSLQ
jgi:SMI1 / KNR4 family (SUKH-1)